MRLLVTNELGRLAKWLRILGFDTEYTKEKNLSSVVIRALRDDRTIISRNHHFPRKTGLKILILESETLNRQLSEAIKELKAEVNDDMMFSRCTVCNRELASMEKKEAQGRVPEYIYENSDKFFTCQQCRRVYWRGSHWGNVASALKSIWNL